MLGGLEEWMSGRKQMSERSRSGCVGGREGWEDGASRMGQQGGRMKKMKSSLSGL